MSRKIFQIVVEDEQKILIDVLLKLTGAKVSTIGRRLLLEWAAAQIDMPGTMRNGACGAHNGACRARPATQYSLPGRLFICETCAGQLNDRVPGTAVPATELHQPAINLDKMREAVQAEMAKQGASDGLSAKSTESLLGLIRDAAAELLSRGKEEEACTFESVVERFS